MHCPCGSGSSRADCCEPSLDAIGLGVNGEHGTYLLDWVEKYAHPISESFHKKARTFGYRISRYLDGVLDAYMGADYPSRIELTDTTDEIFRCQKHNIALTIAGAYRLLSEGLFVQSGVLLRTSIESCFVLLETATNPSCIDLIEKNKYEAQSALKRIKPMIPNNIIKWYGYFSANFTHVAAIHQADYMPRACFSDNWVIITGLQNIVRAIVSYHVVLERAYIETIDDPFFWKKENGGIKFDDNSKIFSWVADLGAKINEAIPVDEKPAWAVRSRRSTTLKN